MSRCLLNAGWVELPAADDAGLLPFLREGLGLTACKPVCGAGDCGACQVLLGERASNADAPRYRALNSCLLTAAQVAGCHVITVEGLNGPTLTPVQQALVDQGGVQCGFCTPGLVIALTGALLNGQSLSEAAAGNLCRCTGYAGIRRAIDVLQASFPACPLSLAEAVGYGLLPVATAQAASELPACAPPPAPLSAPGTVIAGNTDWAVQHAHRAGGEHLRQLHHWPALRQIIEEPTVFRLGAAVTIDEFRQHPAIAAEWPTLPDFLGLFAAPAVRASATLGGNLVNASPVADMAVILLALGAELTLQGPEGSRQLPLTEFYRGYHQTGLQPAELVTAIRIPRHAGGTPGRWRLHAEKVARRTHDDIATVNSALLLAPDVAGNFGALRFSAGGVGPFPLLLERTASCLAGQPISAASVRAALPVVASEIAPQSSLRGSARYKERLLQHLLIAHLCALCPNLDWQECLP